MTSWRNLAPLSMLALLLFAPKPSWAQESSYFFESETQTLVDLTSEAETPLQWTAGYALDWLYDSGSGDYAYATNIFPELFAESIYGGGHADWRIPTKAELQDAAAKGIFSELTSIAQALDTGGPYGTIANWASDPPIKIKGIWSGYWVYLSTGETIPKATAASTLVILVRGGNPPPPPAPTKPPKPR
jgi:hypothetical protein